MTTQTPDIPIVERHKLRESTASEEEKVLSGRPHQEKCACCECKSLFQPPVRGRIYDQRVPRGAARKERMLKKLKRLREKETQLAEDASEVEEESEEEYDEDEEEDEEEGDSELDSGDDSDDDEDDSEEETGTEDSDCSFCHGDYSEKEESTDGESSGEDGEAAAHCHARRIPRPRPIDHRPVEELVEFVIGVTAGDNHQPQSTTSPGATAKARKRAERKRRKKLLKKAEEESKRQALADAQEAERKKQEALQREREARARELRQAEEAARRKKALELKAKREREKELKAQRETKAAAEAKRKAAIEEERRARQLALSQQQEKEEAERKARQEEEIAAYRKQLLDSSPHNAHDPTDLAMEVGRSEEDGDAKDPNADDSWFCQSNSRAAKKAQQKQQKTEAYDVLGKFELRGPVLKYNSDKDGDKGRGKGKGQKFSSSGGSAGQKRKVLKPGEPLPALILKKSSIMKPAAPKTSAAKPPPCPTLPRQIILPYIHRGTSLSYLQGAPATEKDIAMGDKFGAIGAERTKGVSAPKDERYVPQLDAYEEFYSRSYSSIGHDPLRQRTITPGWEYGAIGGERKKGRKPLPWTLPPSVKALLGSPDKK